MRVQRSHLEVAAGLVAVAICLAAGSSAAGAAKATQKTFATPEEAVTALVAAAKADDVPALLAVLGPEAQPLVSSGDAVADNAVRERFVQRYEESHALIKNGNGSLVLQTGTDQWPFPIPLVHADTGWRFDTQAGKQEILDRRIGANELAAIQASLAYVDAQREYHDRNPQSEPLPTYAQTFASTDGKRDGLFWEAKEGEPPSPVGTLFARAQAEGYALGQGKPAPYHGYYFRILKSQGPNAPGGAYDYVVRGKMIGGFALVAYPAEYRSSGVMTFVVNQDGVVYEKDLGPETIKIAKSMKRFDPDASWTKVPPSAEEPTAARGS